MAVKLSFTASEILNDIILHSLQNDGLQKAEEIEQSFYDAFERISISPEAQNQSNKNDLPDDVKTALVLNEFAIAYEAMSEDVLILDICHVSRYAAILNT